LPTYEQGLPPLCRGIERVGAGARLNRRHGRSRLAALLFAGTGGIVGARDVLLSVGHASTARQQSPPSHVPASHCTCERAADGGRPSSRTRTRCPSQTRCRLRLTRCRRRSAGWRPAHLLQRAWEMTRIASSGGGGPYPEGHHRCGSLTVPPRLVACKAVTAVAIFCTDVAPH
jgi:hypothetical protein